MLLKAGLDPDKVCWKTARIAEERDLAHWLPYALAHICSLIEVYHGGKKLPKIADLFRSWGLSYEASKQDKAMQESREVETVRAFEMVFGPIERKNDG